MGVMKRGSAGSRGSGSRRPMFNFRGALFNSQEIHSLLDRKTSGFYESLGRAMRRDIMRSIKPAKRFQKVEQIPKNDPYYARQRQIIRIKEAMWKKGQEQGPIALPWRPSKPGKVPKARGGNTSLFRRGIGFSQDRNSNSLLVGAEPLARSRSKTPSVLEHGGMSGKAKIAARPFASASLRRMTKNGRMQKIFEKRFKV